MPAACWLQVRDEGQLLTGCVRLQRKGSQTRKLFDVKEQLVREMRHAMFVARRRFYLGLVPPELVGILAAEAEAEAAANLAGGEAGASDPGPSRSISSAASKASKAGPQRLQSLLVTAWHKKPLREIQSLASHWDALRKAVACYHVTYNRLKNGSRLALVAFPWLFADLLQEAQRGTGFESSTLDYYSYQDMEELEDLVYQ